MRRWRQVWRTFLIRIISRKLKPSRRRNKWRKSERCKQKPLHMFHMLKTRKFSGSLIRFLWFMNRVLVLFSMKFISRSFSSKSLSFSSPHLQSRHHRFL